MITINTLMFPRSTKLCLGIAQRFVIEIFVLKLSSSTVKLLAYYHIWEPVVGRTCILLFSLEKKIKVIGKQLLSKYVFSSFENSEMFCLGKEVEIPVGNADYIQNHLCIFWWHYKAWQFILKSSVRLQTLPVLF